MIGIIAAIDEEFDTLIKNFTVLDIDTDNVIKFYHLVSTSRARLHRN